MRRLRRGGEVFIAIIEDGEVVVESARIASPVQRGVRWLDVDRTIGGISFPGPEDVSLSRVEALERLTRRLESEERHSRLVAQDFTDKAERFAALATEARKQAGAAAPKKKGGAR